MSDTRASVERVMADTAFSGVVRIDRAGAVEFVKAAGLADRRHCIPNQLHTQFAIASGSKGMTALAVVSLVEEGVLDLSTPARSILGGDLPLITGDVTVEHLLAHRSGIGDYLDEEAGSEVTDYVLPVPIHDLATTEGFLPILDGRPTKFPAGERFSYCNGGYVVLGLIAERASGTPFHDLVRQRVCEPAGLSDTEFLRSDELPGHAAVGYLETDGLRTNVLHLPVRGNGDGGVYTTVSDIHTMWEAFSACRIVSEKWVTEMTTPQSDVPSESKRFGLGFWLHQSTTAVMLDGYDAGVSFRTVHDPVTQLTYTVVSNTSSGAWPIVRHLGSLLEAAG